MFVCLQSQFFNACSQMLTSMFVCLQTLVFNVCLFTGSDMYSMFSDAHAFNQDVSSWDVGSVKDMSYMFAGADSFNQDISKWNVSSVTDLSVMFNGARAFNQNLCDWLSQISNTTRTDSMFYQSASCPSEDDPVLPNGPMCHLCN